MPNALTGAPTEVCVGPITYTGTGRHPARRRQPSQPALPAAEPRPSSPPSRRPAPATTAQRVLLERPRVRLRHRRRAQDGVPRDHRRRAAAAGRRRGAGQHVRLPGPAESGALPRVGAAARRRAQPRAARGFPRSACATTSASAAGTCRTSPMRRCEALVDLILQVNAGAYSHRSRQSAPRARVAGLGGPQAARRQDPDPGRRHPPPDDRRAPAPGGRPHHSLRQPGRHEKT